MVLEMEKTKKRRTHMGNTFQNGAPPYELSSIFPSAFTQGRVFFPPHKHLVLVIPLITVHSVNSRLTDSSGCEKAAMSTRLTKGSSFSVIST